VSITFREQERIEDFIQFSGSPVDWASREGFNLLLSNLEKAGFKVRIEDHQPQWKVQVKDSEGAILGAGSTYDAQPYEALAKAVIQAAISSPYGYYY